MVLLSSTKIKYEWHCNLIVFKLFYFFLNILQFYIVPKSQADYFFSYTDFVVNYDEGQYIPNFFIHLICTS